MDKETLSNYGWIVICVLVIAVMVALATPFGGYIKSAVENTTQGLYDTSAGAINSTNLMHIAGQSFDGSAGGSSSAYNHDDPALHPTGTIPEGGTYTVAAVYVQTGMFEWDCELVSDEVVYNAGDEFPQNVTLNDCYQYGDYAYTYSEDYGWMVNIDYTKTDKNQTSYGAILESINGEPITFMGYTFRDFTLLTMSPIIPNGVTDMQYAFEGCTSLTTIPTIPDGVTVMGCAFQNCTSLTDLSDFVIPNSVTNMGSTFSGCTSLTTAPVIPDGVTDMRCTFEGCTSLTGTITVNANPTLFGNCLKNCGDSTHPITLTGSSTKLTQLKNTAGAGHTDYITISQ